MYSLINDGKVIGTADVFKDALDRAKAESLVPKNWERGFPDGRVVKGRVVNVWSGPIGSDGRGVVKHASYACGASW